MLHPSRALLSACAMACGHHKGIVIQNGTGIVMYAGGHPSISAAMLASNCSMTSASVTQMLLSEEHLLPFSFAFLFFPATCPRQKCSRQKTSHK